MLLVAALLLAGGMSLGLMSSRAALRDARLHQEALNEELTHVKNHMHHIEVRGASADDPPLWAQPSPGCLIQRTPSRSDLRLRSRSLQCARQNTSTCSRSCMAVGGPRQLRCTSSILCATKRPRLTALCRVLMSSCASTRKSASLISAWDAAAHASCSTSKTMPVKRVWCTSFLPPPALASVPKHSLPAHAWADTHTSLLRLCAERRLDAVNALVEAYKQHLSDEVASHHKREENWLHIQHEWERLESEMEQEITA